MHFGGVANEHACQDLPLVSEMKRRCEVAAQPESTIPDLAKLCHNFPKYLHQSQHSSIKPHFHLT